MRYVVNSHFHWDHTQGNPRLSRRRAADRLHRQRSNKETHVRPGSPAAEGIAEMRRAQTDRCHARPRREGLPPPPRKLFAPSRSGRCRPTSARDEELHARIAHHYLRHFACDQDKAHDLHIEFHGHAHTSGDVVVYCPQKRAGSSSATWIHGILPFIADGFPRPGPRPSTRSQRSISIASCPDTRSRFAAGTHSR